MEIVIKITDIKQAAPESTTNDTVTALLEVGDLITEGNKKISTLLDKGRKKIDLVGENCNLEISIK